MGRFVLAWMYATVLAGCGTGAFACMESSECDPAAGGRCEVTGFCSFPDDLCESGYRYGDHAGSGLAMSCVDAPPAGSTSTTDAMTGSAGGESTDPDPSTTIALSDSSGEPACPADWWDCAWPYRRAVVIAPKTTADLEDALVVPIEILEIADATRFGTTGYDLRVVATDGTPIPFEVEEWDRAGPGLLWARLPGGSVADGTVAHVYYGQPDAAAPSDPPTATWTDYEAVWHLTDLIDATGQGQEPADEGSTPADGRFGGGRLFDGADQRLRIAPSAPLADLPVDGMTLIAVTMPNSVGVNLGGRIFDSSDATQSTSGITVMPSQQTMSIEVNRGAATTEASWHGTDPLPFGQWMHLIVTLDDAGGTFAFVDGEPLIWSIEVPPVGEPGSDAMGEVGIGGAPYDATHTFDGIIDEVRVIRGVRSDAWIAANYAVTLGGALSLGAEEVALP